MKTLAISIVLALGLSAPALAQAANPPADSPPAAPTANPAQSAPDTTPIDFLIDDATTQEDRAMLLRRCAGPPPRPIAATDVPNDSPASQPAVVVERAARTGSTGG